MKTRSMVAAIALAFGSAGSFASSFSFDGSMSMGFSFMVDAPSGISAALTSSVVEGYGFDITSATFDGMAFDAFAFGTAPNTGDYLTFAAPSVSAGMHTIWVYGTPLGSTYHANVVLTPVPEPESYALMLAGLGVLGFVASRRRGD